MSESNPFPVKITIGDKYSPAMEITDQEAADAYFERLVAHSMLWHSRDEAERIERINLGYYAGYYSHETRLRVEKLFRCAHPVFGEAVAEKATMTPQHTGKP